MHDSKVMIPIMIKRISTLIFLLVFVMSGILNAANPVAKKGVLDLRNETPDLRSINLSGEWEFYWKQLLTPDDFETGTEQFNYAKVPGYWGRYKDAIPEVTGVGYGTYRLKILMPEGFRDSLAIRIPILDASYKLFLNGEYVVGIGKVGKTKETSSPAYFPQVHNFSNTSDTLELLMQVSNFSHRQGGMWLPLSLGMKELVLHKNERNKVFNYALIGIYLGTFLIFMIFFILERKTLSFLYFSLTTLGIMIRLINTGLYPGNYFFDQNWIWTVRSEYLGTFIAYTFGMLYLNQVFPNRLIGKITRANTYISAILAAIVLVFKPPVFSYTMFYIEFMGPLLLLYYIYISFKGVLKNKIKESAFFFSVLVFMLAVVNDSLVSMSMSPFRFEYLLSITFLLFIVLQGLMVISDWVKNFREKTAMHAELEYVNKNLEKIIDNRTNELRNTNQELTSSLEFKNRLFSIIAHDLKSPLATLAQQSDLLVDMFPEGNNNVLMTDLQRLSYSSIDLIDNLIYWGMRQVKKINYLPKNVNLSYVISDILDLLAAQIHKKEIKLQVSCAPSQTAICDEQLLRIALRNILTNAVKFTGKNGEISIRVSQEKKEIKIEISDKGIGMSMEKIESIFSEKVESTYGTEGEKGTGLGLIVVKDLVEINKGKLAIQSKPGKGTAISFTLPGEP